MPDLSVVIPVQNEEENIRLLVEEVRQSLDGVLDYELEIQTAKLQMNKEGSTFLDTYNLEKFEYAKRYSNKSSLGLFLTEQTYSGKPHKALGQI